MISVVGTVMAALFDFQEQRIENLTAEGKIQQRNVNAP
jgi:hypothetical protein